MGAIRGVLLVFVCTILFLSLFAGNILLTLSSSLRYENAQPQLVSFLGNAVNEQLGISEQLNQILPMMEIYCQTNNQYAFTYGDCILTIPCDTLMQGSDAVIEYGTSSFIDNYYYAEYDCGFWDCFDEGEIPFFLISEKAQEYWQGKFYLSLLLSIALAALVFLLVEKKNNFFLLAGGLMIFSAIPLLWVSRIASVFPSSSGEMSQYLSQIILVFFNQSRSIFVKVLIIAGILVVVGIVLKMFHIGLAISNLFAKIKSSKNVKKVKLDKKIEKVKLDKRIKKVKSKKSVASEDKKEGKNKNLK